MYAEIVELLKTVADGDGDVSEAQLDGIRIVDLLQHVRRYLSRDLVGFARCIVVVLPVRFNDGVGF